MVLNRDAAASDLRTSDDFRPRRATASATPRNLLGYQPALDGLRGLALIAIFFFHAGFSFAPGAFLSVSTFFTLSGFLITVLLIGEHRSAGRIDLKAFWSRRFRRLLPASLVVILTVVVVSWFLADASQLQKLSGDAIACLAYVANWHFIAAGDSYAALFTSKSPFQHFWSLAIEEQFYFVYPLAMVAIFRVGRGKLRAVGIGLGTLIAISVTESIYGWHHGWGVDRLYFGADVRAAELLVGGLVGVWWVREHQKIGDRALPARRGTPRRSRARRDAAAVAVRATHRRHLVRGWARRLRATDGTRRARRGATRTVSCARSSASGRCARSGSSPTARISSIGRCSCSSTPRVPGSACGRCSCSGSPSPWYWPSCRSMSSSSRCG